MKKANGWLALLLAVCLAAGCATSCNSKGDYGAALAALDKTLALETFQVDGIIDSWFDEGEFGMDREKSAWKMQAHMGSLNLPNPSYGAGRNQILRRESP